MAFRFEIDEDAAAGVQRMAHSQTHAALARLVDPEAAGVAETIFDVRKRCKKVRAVARLVRRPLGAKAYRRANSASRDAARALAGVRDDRAVLDAFDSLSARSVGPLAAVDLALVRAGLERAVGSGEPSPPAMEAALGTVEELLAGSAARIERWQLDGDGWPLLADGVAAVHARGAVATARAVKRPTRGRLHELRKEAKYARYHLRMLCSISPTMVGPLLNAFETVGDQLGQARDLAGLESALRGRSDAFGGDEAVASVRSAAAARRGELEAAGLGLARRLYAEPSDAYAARLGHYWELWRANGPEPNVAPEPESDPAPDPAPEPTDNSGRLDELSVARLRVLARARSIPGRSRMNRRQLVEALALPSNND